MGIDRVWNVLKCQALLENSASGAFAAGEFGSWGLVQVAGEFGFWRSGSENSQNIPGKARHCLTFLIKAFRYCKKKRKERSTYSTFHTATVCSMNFKI